jgi:hypothetical protein
MTWRRRISHFATWTRAILLGLTLIALTPPLAKARQPPSNSCAAVTKNEYDAAKQKNLLRTRFGNYVRTGRPLRRVYWYCT